MNPVSEDMKDLLVAAGIGTFASTSAWGIYTNEEPKTPNQCITIYDVPGPRPDYYMNSAKKPLLNPMFQVRVRSLTYLEGWNKHRAIAVVLDRRARFDASGAESGDSDVQYQSITKTTSDPQYLGKDDNNRFLWVWTYQAFRREKA